MADNDTAKAKPKPMTKALLYQKISEETELPRKKVGEVFDSLVEIIKQQLGKKGPGQFTIPGLLKLKLTRKKATKERKGPNPFKPGEEMVFKAKPARNLVKARALKTLNELVK